MGTSGWQYDDWRGTFYPTELRQRDWLEFFAGRFSTVEVNNTFYRLPPASVFASWRRATPDGFMMSVKASRFLTHLKRLREPAEPTSRLWAGAVELGPRLGPILFQLPPRFPADPPRLAELLRTLPRELQPAFEFRDPSWHVPEIFELLESRRAALVWGDVPGARLKLPLTGGWAYLRMHRGRRVAPGYTSTKLRRLADRIADLPADLTWVYFNNDTGTAAVRDAHRMVDLLSERGADVVRPPSSGAQAETRRASA